MSTHLGETERPAGTDGKSLRVLCVDDDEHVGWMLEIALARAGVFVERAHDAEVAFARIAADVKFFDVLVTDHRMPSLSGLELVRRLRHVGFGGKIIVHSSHLDHRETHAYRALRVSDFLTKPVTISELLTTVHSTGGHAP